MPVAKHTVSNRVDKEPVQIAICRKACGVTLILGMPSIVLQISSKIHMGYFCILVRFQFGCKNQQDQISVVVSIRLP